MINYIINSGIILFIIVYVPAVLVLNYIWLNRKRFISWGKLQWKNAPVLKKIYIGFAGAIGSALFVLFVIFYSQIILFPFGLSSLKKADLNAGFALAFLGTITGGVALFTGFIAILRSETNERQSTAAEEQSKAAHDQNKISDKKNTIAEETNKMTKWQNEIASRQAHTAEQESITERINKAIENLAKNHENHEPILEVRIGTLYDLERIAKDSERDHRQIIEMLCAYIRLNSPLTSNIKELKGTTRRKPRKDIQTALTIIGRHDSWLNDDARLKAKQDRREVGGLINLSYCDLEGADIHSANLRYARIQHANLNGASIHNTDMTSTNFYWTDMIDAFIGGSNLTQTGFSHSNMRNSTIVNNSNLNNTQFSGTNLSNAKIMGVKTHNLIFISADLTEADITDIRLDLAEFFGANLKDTNLVQSYSYNASFLECKNLTKEQLNTIFCGIDVKIPSHLEPRPEHWPTEKLSEDDFEKAYKEWRKERMKDPKNKPSTNSKNFTDIEL